MNKSSTIYIPGHTGMVGSAIVRLLTKRGYTNLVTRSHAELDLTCQADVNDFFANETIDYVFLAAAKVGGIHANNTYPAEFIYKNLMIQSNVIHASYKAGVKRLLFLGSSCIYPKEAPQPMKEEHLLTGLLESTNEPYAIAKIAGIKMCESYNRQYDTCFLAVMPTNLYGPNDSFDLETSHVLPALIRKFYEAKVREEKEVIVWGTGNPRREFLHVDDMADACLFLMNLDEQTVNDHFLNYPQPCFVNLGTGVDCSIRELAERIRDIVGGETEIVFDTSKPDGTPQKLLDVSRLTKLGWQSNIGLIEGIRKTYEWYLNNVA